MPAQTRRQTSQPASDSGASAKRKEPPTKANKEQPEQKVSKTTTNGKSSELSAKHIVNFLLSAEAIPYCYPEDELKAAKSGDFVKTYSMTPPSSFSPFETLIISHLLSKPLSHTLGMRSIRTILNKPFDLTTPQKVKEAGEKRVWEALEEARTQHRQKTATYIYQMAEAYCNDETMFRLSEECNDGGASGTIQHIKDSVSGMGQTGAEIWCRRAQSIEGWGEALWPFADSKSLDALRQLGVDVKNGDELESLVEEVVDFDRVGQMGMEKLVGTGRETGGKEKLADMEYEQRVAVEFVVLLERAVGVVLEKKVDELKKAASQWK